MTKKKHPSHELVAEKLAIIEAEMRQVGLWQEQPLAPEKYRFQEAFGMDTMAFSQWLQFVFLPRVRNIVDAQGAFPPTSMVGAQACREFDGQPEASTLVRLLSEFDDLFGRS